MVAGPVERLKQLLEEVVGFNEVVYCDSLGCVRARYVCERLTDSCGWRVETYGLAGQAVERLVELLEEYVGAYTKLRTAQEAFKAGKLPLKKLLEVKEEFKKVEMKLSVTFKNSRKTLNETLLIFTSVDREDSNPCKKLAEALNELVEHPEAEEG